MPGSSVPWTPQEGTIVLGLGNPLLGDDGVGWCVADEVERRLADAGWPDRDLSVEVDRLSVGGLRLMERLAGYDAAIVVDAATIPGRSPGSVEACLLEDLPVGGAGHLDSSHDTSLVTALAVGRRLGASLPGQVAVVTVQAERVLEFGESLTPAVEAAVPEAADAVLQLLTIPTVRGGSRVSR